MTRVLCGVDVSSESLAARIGQDGAEASFANSPQGIAALASFCRMHRVELVVMEATGGYEQRAFALLWAEGLPVAIVNPRAVRRFAEGMGLEEKTDAIDAGMIAWFAATRRTQAQPPASPAQLHLRALVTRLRQLTLVRAAQRNQRRLVTDGAVREILFVVASVAARYKPDFVAFHQRLRRAGKPPKVARIALAHKLLVRLNAKARDVRHHLAATSLSGGSLVVTENASSS